MLLLIACGTSSAAFTVVLTCSWGDTVRPSHDTGERSVGLQGCRQDYPGLVTERRLWRVGFDCRDLAEVRD